MEMFDEKLVSEKSDEKFAQHRKTEEERQKKDDKWHEK